MSKEVEGNKSQTEVDQGAVANAAELLQTVAGLDHQQAKAVAYWALAAHAVKELQQFPMLAIRGAAGTGKTTILKTLNELCKGASPALVDGSVATVPIIREEMRDRRVMLIDEADRVSERLLIKRFDRAIAAQKVNVKVAGEWSKKDSSIYGATALHKRLPFRDHATTSRSVEIKTARKGKGEIRAATDDELTKAAAGLEALARSIDWKAARGGGRIADTWAPLLHAARTLSDEDWLAWADKEMMRADLALQQGAEEEPTGLVFSTFLRLALGGGSEPAERVGLADLRKDLDGQGSNYTSQQVGALLRELGFDVRKVGGTTWAYTGGKQNLVAVGKVLGGQDDWLAAAA
jgi:energy-coupling factor transporter ATP-binding protein EcfA2